MTQEKMARTSVTIPESVLEAFKEYCVRQRRSVSAQITILIEQTLKAEAEERSNG
ncbi:hypothetical protein [Synechococcus sp. PCC 7336]|uniref:ribbon-helix-helix domain-containing protein n=1 Tax=Synechococcus sp. PCC 7336 TaxID=195250 RepID=UPI0003490B74|nr:hypothetical protein [Synechococcus sp. PCC 7336]